MIPVKYIERRKTANKLNNDKNFKNKTHEFSECNFLFCLRSTNSAHFAVNDLIYDISPMIIIQRDLA